MRQLIIVVLGVAAGVLAVTVASALAGYTSMLILECDPMSGQCWVSNVFFWTNPPGGCA